jgi:hypothetical protein
MSETHPRMPSQRNRIVRYTAANCETSESAVAKAPNQDSLPQQRIAHRLRFGGRGR